MEQKCTQAKKYLRTLRSEQLEIRNLMRKRENIRLSLIPPAIRYDNVRVQTTVTDAMTERLAEACKLDDEIVDHVKRLDARRAEAMRAIRQMDDANCRMVLELYYLTLSDDGTLLRWEDVAEKMGYSEIGVLKIHGRALEKFSKIEGHLSGGDP